VRIADVDVNLVRVLTVNYRVMSGLSWLELSHVVSRTSPLAISIVVKTSNDTQSWFILGF
jgi:hypothetical protein